MSEPDGLMAAYVLDGKGGGKPLDWAAVKAWHPDDGVLWAHLDINDAEAAAWVRTATGGDALAADALLAENTRPRVVDTEKGVAIFLRGVNLNPHADPEDMVGVRILLEPGRIITMRLRRLVAIEDLRAAIERGQGPKSANGFIAQLTRHLVQRMEPVLTEIEDRVADLEVRVYGARKAPRNLEFGPLRTQVIVLRRFLKPQKDALASLRAVGGVALSGRHMALLRETQDQLTRYVENLDALHDRLGVANEELRFRQGERMSRGIYLLTMLSAVLMPPNLVAAAFGVNLGGIPGNQAPWAFPALAAGIVLLCLAELWLLRRLRWL